MELEVYEDMESHEGDWWMRGRIAVIRSMISSEDRKTAIIDLGAGVGQVASALKADGFEHIVTTDNSPVALRLLQQKGFEAYEVVLPDIQLKERFDLALLLDVLEHVDDDQLTLENIFKLLQSGGRLLLTVPAHKFLWSKKDELVHHKRRYSLRELRTKLERAGFAVDYISYYNFFLFLPALIFSLVNKRRVALKRYNSVIDKLLYPIFSSERYFLKNGVFFPTGVSLIVSARKQ